jgi:glycosyltransferase involved in cell wall biosynthesis
MEVSVVIPVYRAEKFIEAAVESVLAQPQTKEVVLVEDGSPDNSLEICQRLSAAHEKVKLYRHPDHGNHGASATRNLGIQKANCEYVAFLDADDLFLPGRFDVDEEVFREYPDADGVYNAIGAHYFSEEGKRKHIARFRKMNMDPDLTTLSVRVPPEKLFETVLTKPGWFSFIAATIKRSAFEKSGLFDNELGLGIGEDTEMLYRMALTTRLYPGSLDLAKSSRGVHDDNRILDKDLHHTYLMLLWQKLFRLARTHPVNKNCARTVFKRYLRAYNKPTLEAMDAQNVQQIRMHMAKNAIAVLLRYPAFLLKIV